MGLNGNRDYKTFITGLHVEQSDMVPFITLKVQRLTLLTRQA